MARIEITRTGPEPTGSEPDNVEFPDAFVSRTDNVFFINLDPLRPHWPDLISNELGPAPSFSSNPVQFGREVKEVEYHCQIAGHDEKGTIKIVDDLAAVNTTLTQASSGQPIMQKVVKGGRSPYIITDENFEVAGPDGGVIKSGSGIGPELQLTTDDTGVFVEGTPTLSGTYTFRFTVDDGMGANLQQIQYTMVVT
jgi:hypothetical protein